MKTLLLLAGRSKRFWPLADKNFFQICGKTLLEHQIERLNSAGITDITLVGGEHNLAQASAIFPKLNTVKQENLDLGMRGALLSALPSVGDNPVFIVSGNDVLEPSGYLAVLKTSKETDGGALLAKKIPRYFPGGYLTVNGKKIVSIVEKPEEGKEPSDLINLVAHVHNNASFLLKLLADVDESKDDGYEQALQKCFDLNTYFYHPYHGKWQAIKYPWHLLDLSDVLLTDISKPVIHKSAFIHKTAVLDGNVVLCEGVKVFAHASIRGPCFIGKNTIVANNALVRNSSIGENCVIGFSTEVKGSVLGNNVWTHMTYLGDTVVGNNVSFGAGCVTGNFRLDEKVITPNILGYNVSSYRTKLGSMIGENSRLGIQVGLNPGCCVGCGCFVSGGTYVKENIPDNSFVYMKNGEINIKENREKIASPEERNIYKKDL